MMYKRILVATDGSKFSKAAVNEAIRIAKASKGALIIVSAVDITEEFESEAPELTERFERQFKTMVERIKKQAKAKGIKVDGVVKIGEPYDVIINAAKEKKADLIVMGSHGRRGLSRLLMGSVTERVIGHAKCPVLVIKE
jgi:nucleotide-binding universal stress UspA family protein